MMVRSPLSLDKSPSKSHDLGYTQTMKQFSNQHIEPSFQPFLHSRWGAFGTEAAPSMPSVLASASPALSAMMWVEGVERSKGGTGLLDVDIMARNLVLFGLCSRVSRAHILP